MDTLRIPFPASPLRNRRAPRIALVLLGLILLCAMEPTVGLARGWIGVSVQDLDRPLRAAMGPSVEGGALVTDVTPGSPADAAGLRSRDVIVDIDGTAVEEANDLVDYLRERNPGDKVRIAIVRDEARIDAEVVLEERPASDRTTLPAPLKIPRDGPLPWTPFEHSLEGAGVLGVRVQALDRHLAPYFDAEPGQGLLILSVQPGSPADRGGLFPGDVIQSFNGSSLAEAGDLRREVRRLGPREEWSARVIRRGEKRELHGVMERDWQSPTSATTVHPPHQLMPDRGGETTRGSREARRFEREMDRLRERVRELERRLDRMREH
jgi:predicted metalloprotease with PDZ domain